MLVETSQVATGRILSAGVRLPQLHRQSLAIQRADDHPEVQSFVDYPLQTIAEVQSHESVRNQHHLPFPRHLGDTLNRALKVRDIDADLDQKGAISCLG